MQCDALRFIVLQCGGAKFMHRTATQTDLRCPAALDCTMHADCCIKIFSAIMH
jgi:hypothetical protein